MHCEHFSWKYDLVNDSKTTYQNKKIFCDTEAIELSREIFHIVDFDTKTGLL